MHQFKLNWKKQFMINQGNHTERDEGDSRWGFHPHPSHHLRYNNNNKGQVEMTLDGLFHHLSGSWSVNGSEIGN